MVDIKVPGVGESVQEGMIGSWMKNSGDQVEVDDVLLELETDKASVEVVAESAGTLTVLVEAGEVVKVGQVIGRIAEGVSTSPSVTVAAEEKQEQLHDAPASQQNLDPGPAVRRMVAEGASTEGVEGSGRGGRVTKSDLLSSASVAKPEPAVAQKAATPQAEVKKPIFDGAGRVREVTREPMSMLRRRIADRLVEAQHTAAILTTFNEVDMTSVMALRKNYQDSFQKKYGMKLGFMGFFLKASLLALKKYPRMNAFIQDKEFIYHNYCDVGVAVSTPKGLVVPVIRDADLMDIPQLEMAIAGFAEKARNNKITVDDLTGGTFTVSNGGVFGSLMSTPILNPPQSGILGMHKTQQRPMVMPDGSIEARPMMYLALSYDHRLVDGKEAVGFLIAIKEFLEDPARALIGV
ncbi:MAG: 2-oxoglutarate dehydrogenase complex dihydrolipoyllysine-residue succinyltransferase [Oligoflexales bacterium]